MFKKYPTFYKSHFVVWCRCQAKEFTVSFRPTVAMLVFLFMFGYAQQCLVSTKPPEECSLAAPVSVFAIAKHLPARIIDLGSRTLVVTRHASERMQERQVSIEEVTRAVRDGQLFAYLDKKLVKIGYYDINNGLFLAVDQRHKKLITVIKFVDGNYPERVMTRKS